MLNRTHRFHGLNSLDFTYKRGQQLRAGPLVLRYARNPRRSTYRVAVVVSKKVDKSAVQRNRIRRRVYEAVRMHAGTITEPYDLIFSAYDNRLTDTDMRELRAQIKSLLKRAGVSSPPSSASHAIVDRSKSRPTKDI